MAVFRIEKTNDYTTMSNHHLKNEKLSLKAKGLLSLMLALPENWNYSKKGLISICKEGKAVIESTLNELKDNHYLTIEEQRIEGKFDYVYNIFEEPYTEKPSTVKPNTENQPQLNTNNKILNNKKEINNNKLLFTKKSFKKPTVEEVNLYCQERNNGIDAEKFIDYYESNGWKVGKNPMRDWKACIRTWEKNDKNQKQVYSTYQSKRISEQDKAREQFLNGGKND